MNHKANAVLHSIVCLLLLTSVSAAQELDAQFKKIKDGIFTYVGTSGESNCTIILTQDGVVLIDSGNFPKDSRAVLDAVKKLTSQPVRLLINTEPHADHTTGHFVFSPPAVVVAAAGAGDSMRASNCQADSRKARAAFAVRGLSHDHAACRIPRPNDHECRRAHLRAVLPEERPQ